MKLPLPSLEIQVKVCDRVLGADTLLALARHGDAPEAWKVIRDHTSTCGGGGDGFTYWCEGKGAFDEQVDPTWHVSWSRMVEICRAGLTPGNVAGMSSGYRRYIALHRDPWQSQIPPFVPGGWEVNAVSDPIAYDLIYFPEYCAATDLMREAEHDVFRRALEVLSDQGRGNAQMTMELSA